MQPEMLEIFLLAFTTFFATIDPVGTSVIFPALTVRYPKQERKRIAIRGVFIATVVLVLFALVGDLVLKYLGISLPALRIAGGILLLLIAMEMVLAHSDSGALTTTEQEQKEAATKQDITVCPLAMPLIAGPGSMGAAILLVAQADGDVVHVSLVISALLANLFLCLILFLIGSNLQKIFGITGLNVLSRIIGVLLAALSVQFILDGIASSGLLA